MCTSDWIVIVTVEENSVLQQRDVLSRMSGNDQDFACWPARMDDDGEMPMSLSVG